MEGHISLFQLCRLVPVLPAAKHKYFAGAGDNRIYWQNGMYNWTQNILVPRHIGPKTY